MFSTEITHYGLFFILIFGIDINITLKFLKEAHH